MRRPVPEPQLLTGAPFRTSDALALGVTRSRLRSSLWRPLGRDLFVAADAEDTQDLYVAAAQLVMPRGAVISGFAAARAYGIDIARGVLEPVDITTPGSWVPAHRNLVRPHRAPLPDQDVEEINGVPVTSALRTLYDLARCHDPVEAVVAIDAFWHAGLVTPDELLAFAHDRGWPDGAKLRAALALADPGAQSPMESRLRMLLTCDELPRPVTQYKIPDGFGGAVADVDIAFPPFPVGAEYDGRVHLDDAVRIRDLRRHNRIRSVGWTVFPYSADDYYHRGHVIRRQVIDAVHKAAA